MTKEMYEKIEDHDSEIKARSVWQYKGKEYFDKLRQAYAERTQEYEDIIWRLLLERALSNARGVNLDRRGEFFLVERQGLADGLYRNLIFTIRNRFQAAGQIEILLASLRLMAANNNVSLTQVFPAAILTHIFVDNFGDTFNPGELNIVMQAIKAAGVRLVIGEQLNSSAFIFSDNPAGGNPGEGFSEFSDGTGGGAFPHILD